MIISTSDNVKLNVQKTGEGTAVLFVHEFGGDQRSWKPQINYFSRRYECITFNARGYPPSDVPESIESYSQERAIEDIADVMKELSVDKAHIVGLSMGGFAALHFGIKYPEKAISLTVAGSGYGAEKQYEDYFRNVSRDVASQFIKLGSKEFSKIYAKASSRIPFLIKDKTGWEDFLKILSEHSNVGASMTMKGVQAKRPSLYDLEDEIKNIEIPTLIVLGDEDDHCINPGIFLKRCIKASGLLILPKTGHTINLEEPSYFNNFLSDFFSQVENNKWLPRDPRSNPQEIMRT